MPANVSVLLNVAVFPSATANVLPVAGAVIESLLMLVAVATPSVGVVKEGEIKFAFKSSADCRSVCELNVPVMLPHAPPPPPDAVRLPLPSNDSPVLIVIS